MSKAITRALTLVLLSVLAQPAFAHNGSVAYAYPLGKISINGDFSDWPKNINRYAIRENPSDTKPKNDADFSGFFQLGYRLDDRSLYVAFTITDDSFLEDTSANVRWNTQDGLEVSIDGRHLLSGSGVAKWVCICYASIMRKSRLR